jgi:hypothetical protein
VVLDDSLRETAAVLEVGDEPVARVESASGSPARPMSEDQLALKVRRLAGGRLAGALEPHVAARDVLAATGLV